MPRAQSMCGLLVVSRGKDAKKLPFGTRVILLPVQTFPTLPPECAHCCCQTPRHKQWQSSVNPRAKRRSSSRRWSPSTASASFSDSAYRAARPISRYKAKTCVRLNCPARSPPANGSRLGTIRVAVPTAGWLQAGWLTDGGGMDGCIACISLHHAATLLLCSTPSA